MINKPSGSTVKITLQDGSTMDLSNHWGVVAPILSETSILNLVRNTSVKPAESITGNTVYVGANKPISKVGVQDAANGQGSKLTNDPRTTLSREIEGEATRHTPETAFDKVHGIGYDLSSIRGQEMLAQQAASWISTRDISKEIEVFEAAVVAAEIVQKDIIAGTTTGNADAKATTFSKGAHVQTGAILDDVNKAYKAFFEAKGNFQRLGLKTNATEYNQELKGANGVKVQDMFVLMTPEFEATLLGHPGVFASDKGFDAFSNAGLKRILGVITTSSVTLPEGVNFMFITTGVRGAVGHQLVGQGYGINMIKDPAFSFDLRLDSQDVHTKGIVYKDNILVQKEQ